MITHKSLPQKTYECPKVVLLKVFIEESISTSSASIVIGDPDEVYQPMVENWTQGSVSNDTYEF